jgi:hypothetical protein
MKQMISLIFGTLLVFGGCSSGSDDTQDASDSGTVDTAQSADTSVAEDSIFSVEDTSVSADMGSPNPEDGIDSPTCTANYVESLQGKVHFEDGSGAKGAKAQFCVVLEKNGSLQCLQPADVADDGSFQITVPSLSSCIESATSRVVMPPTYCSEESECGGVACVPQRFADGGVCHTGHATMYCEADLGGGSPNVSVDAPFILYALDIPQVLPTLGDEEEVRTVVFADGLELDFRPFDIFASGGGYNAMAAKHFEVDTPGFCHLETTTVEFDGVYGFSPESNIIGQSNFPLRMPNRDDAAPGTEYELYILGGLQCQLQDRSHVGESEWKLFTTAVVNDEGTFIETAEGEGLPCLNWLAYRQSSE